MQMAVKLIPEGYHTVTPYVVVNGVAKLMDFLRQAFEAKGGDELMRRPDGSVAHAEVRLGDSVVMMGEPAPGQPVMPAAIYLYVKDTDTSYQRALKAGATSLMEPADQFYGDRNAGVLDPFGNRWWIATHVEDVAPEEMRRRAEAAFRQQRRGA
jgi:PhnB protein